jgi:hypothetical protein
MSNFLVLVPSVLILAAGWALHRFARASARGTILWCAAAVAMSVVGWTATGGDAEMIREVCALVWLLLSLVSGIIFLIVAARQSAGRVGNCAGCALALFTIIVPLAAGGAAQSRLHRIEQVRRTARMILIFHRLGAEVEAIRTRLGRLPADEEELVRLRGKPMPPDGEKYRIRYYRRDEKQYDMSYNAADFWGRHWDLFGWIFHYYGPSSPQRLHAELF